MKNKKIKYIVMVVLISVVLSLLIIPNMIYRLNEQIVAQDVLVEDIDISAISEGDFTGSFQSGHMSADVEVIIQNGEYISIILISSVGINPARAQEVTQSIIKNQTIVPDDGDIGSQFTDKIVQKAVYYAVLQNYRSVVADV